MIPDIQQRLEGHERIGACIRDLQKRNKKASTVDTILALEDLIQTYGANNENLIALLDLVLSNSSQLTALQRRHVVLRLLVPDQSDTLPTEIIYRILGLVGNLEHQGLGKTPAKALQLSLLEWLVSLIHLFGSEIYTKLRHMSPILFNYLSYEYPRPYICHLIFLALTTNLEQSSLVYNTVKHPIKSVKEWQIQKVVDLYVKFPGDEYLKSLLVLFHTLDPNLDLEQYSRGNIPTGNLNNLNQNIYQYAKDDYLERLNTVSTNVSIIEENEKARRDAQTKLNTISYIAGRYKRRKISSESNYGGDTCYSFNPLKTSIVEIQSIEDLLANFERIVCLSSSSILNRPVLTLQKRLERLYINLNSMSFRPHTRIVVECSQVCI